MKKRIGSLLLILALCFTLLPTAVMAEESVAAWDGSIATAFAGGSGTGNDPYQIADGAQLAYLANSVNGGESYADTYFVLTANIDLAIKIGHRLQILFLTHCWEVRIIASSPVILTVTDIPSLTFPLGQRLRR